MTDFNMEKNTPIYIAIDLKSFYASVECVDKGLDPIAVNLVVADAARSQNTICLAVSPSLKALGVPGRPRLFEVIQKVDEINRKRLNEHNLNRFEGKSYYQKELEENPSLAVDYIIAPPRMQRYMDYSTRIYDIYCSFIAPDDIDVYSIDEVFMEVSTYLHAYQCSPEELCIRILREVYNQTGLTATAGIGTNMFLAKIAMDVVAKKATPNEFGVRMASLTEESYRYTMWNHQPLSDFWSIGPGIEKRLKTIGIYTMGDLARCSLENEDLLYRVFGVRAEFLIDHAWGYETAKISDIKKIVRRRKSMSQGQVLPRSYTNAEGKVVIQEMAEQLCLDLMKEGLVCSKIVLDIGYDKNNHPNKSNSQLNNNFYTDQYGRIIPKPAHGTVTLPFPTVTFSVVNHAVLELYSRITVPYYNVRRLRVCAIELLDRDQLEGLRNKTPEPYQTDLFAMIDPRPQAEEPKIDKEKEEKEIRAQKAMIKIKEKYGKNAILKGNNFEKSATAIERNRQIGGHKA
ncbi:MAG: hypothetical protein J6Z28_05520 [Succinivibrio sp.]|nr:hypothetical protein [Succinivibrio sp.]